VRTDELEKLSACKRAVEWVAEQPSAAAAWRNCERGDWMLWLLGRLSGEPGSAKRKRLVLCCCQCARLALTHVPAGEDRPRLAIETAERWARGEGPTLSDVRAAADAADAAYAAYVAAYADAAYAAYAAYAAHAAHAVHADAACAAYAADAAASAVAHAAGDAYYAAYVASDARAKTLAECADIVREHYPQPPRLRGDA